MFIHAKKNNIYNITNVQYPSIKNIQYNFVGPLDDLGTIEL